MSLKCTTLLNILTLGYNHDVTDDIKGYVLFFIPVSGFLFTRLPLPTSLRLYPNLSFDSNERKTGPFDYRGTLGVEYRDSVCVCVMCSAVMRHNIVPSPPLVFTAESESQR